jgi:hypothetical protein
LTKINKTGKTYFVLPSASSKPIEIKAGQNGNVVLGLQSGILTVTDETLVRTKKLLI